IMQQRRGLDAPERLCAGPGRLCQALGITRAGLDGWLMARSPVVVVGRNGWEGAVDVTPRIGITKAADWPLRYTAEGSRWLSRRGLSTPRASATERPRG